MGEPADDTWCGVYGVIELAFITWNRLEYTRLALPRLLADPAEEFQLSIWDNGSTDGTRGFLNKLTDPRIKEIKFSNENVGQVEAVNAIWSGSEAELLGKVDNDCLLTPGWTRTLADAHQAIPELGVVACWHFFPDDFEYERAEPKIETHNGHQILRHPWTCGTGLLIKRTTYNEIGPLRGDSTTHYWMEMARRGYVNGFYYPLIHQEHMDDPKSKYTRLKDEKSYQLAKRDTFNINRHGQVSLTDRWQRRQQVLDNILDDPWDPSYYAGWRGRIRRWKRGMRRGKE